MEQEHGFIIRYGAPNQYDQAPFGTRCKVVNEQEVFFYIQLSRDEIHPRWEPVSSWDEVIIS